MKEPEKSLKPHSEGTDRRDFLKRVAAMAVYSSPVISLLAGSSRSAWADCPIIGEGGEVYENGPPALRALIDIIVAGVDGDTTRQAIQMRFFQTNQCVDGMALIARDAAGNNPVALLSITSEVANNAVGDTVLIASPNFSTTDSPSPDFIMSNLLPSSYLSAGSLTWESASTVCWRVCWGGAGYTGSAGVTSFNDSDGTVAPAFNGGLPSLATSGLMYDPNYVGQEGASSSQGDSNWSEADYRFTTGAAILKNNAGETATLPVTLQMFVVS